MGSAISRRTRRVRAILVGLAVYVACYLVLSRIGFQWAAVTGCDGFCFVPPTTTTTRAVNKVGIVVFYPLIFLDNVWRGLLICHIFGHRTPTKGFRCDFETKVSQGNS